MVKDKVDWYLDELVGELELQTGKLVSIPTLWRSLVYCGISRKKVSFSQTFSELYYLLYIYIWKNVYLAGGDTIKSRVMIIYHVIYNK